ncbi:hypothetical protein ACJMK2_042641, partial [Sinanodonta woodiana]
EIDSDIEIVIDDNSGSDEDENAEDAGEEDENERRADQWIINDRTHVDKRPYTGPAPGPTTDLDPNANEFNFFELYFSSIIVSVIVDETNLYARQKQQEKDDPIGEMLQK